MTAIQYISQLGSAASWGPTDLIPVTQGSTGPLTGTTLSLTVAKLFTSPALTGTTTIGNDLANYFTATGGAVGLPPILGAAGSDTSVGVGLLPKGDYMTTTTRLLVGPQASWAAAQTSNLTRLRTQLAAFHNSTTQASGSDFYPQFSTTGGAMGGTLDTGSRFAVNTFSVDSDNVNVTGAGPSGLSLLYLGLGVGNANGAAGSGHTGNRNALDAQVFINSNVDIGGPTNKFHVGVAGGTTAFYKMGGTAGGPRGNVFGSNVWARGLNGSGPGPRYLNSLVGMEIDVAQDPNVSVLWKVGLQIVEENDAGASADQQNIGLSITNQPSASTLGWDQGISFGAYNGQFPMRSSGQLIATLPSPIGISSAATADGMNFARVAFSRAAIETPSFYLDGAGQAGGVRFGGQALQTVSALNAKVSTVSSVTVVDGGLYDGATFPTFTLEAPSVAGAAGVTATMTVTNMGAGGFSGISTGGNGLYVAGETLTAVGGTGTAFTVYIETVSAGVPTNIRIATAGNYTVLPADPVSFTGSAAGTGFSVGMRWKILTVSNTAGTNYNEFKPPAVTKTGAVVQTKEARFKVAMTAGTMAALSLNSQAQAVTSTMASFLLSNQTLSGTLTSSANPYVNNINLVDGANTTGGGGPGALNYFTIIDSLTASATGGRNGLLSIMSLNGAMTNAAANIFYNAASYDCNVSYNQGGTAAGGNYAKLVAFTGEASARAGATYINSLEASENGAGVRAGASAGYVSVMSLSPLGYAGSRGGFWMYNGLTLGHGDVAGTDGEGFDAGIGIGAAFGNLFPIARTGSIVEIQTPNGAPTNTVAWGVDFARGTFDGGAWRSPGFAISPIGTVGGVSVYGTALQTQSTIKAASAVVNTITVVNGGAFEAIPTLTISAPPLGGTTATATVASMKAARAFIDTQGSGYTNGDVLTLSGGTFGTSAQVTVTVAGGLITEIVVSRAGSYTVLPSNAVSTSGGTGTGAKFYMQWGINAVTVTGAGTNYPTYPAPFVSCSGEKSIKALFTVNMTETQQTLVVNSGATTQTTSRIVGTRVVTAAGAVTVATTDDIVIINKTVGAATVANLPASPETGRRYTIKDGKGDAAANNITITPAAGNIDGAATSVINTNFGRATVAYNGTQWNLV